MRPHSKSTDLAIFARFPPPPDSARKAYSFADVVNARLTAAASVVREWERRWRSRRELRSLSQREITDFCPKLTDALREAEKPFWRP
jgi:uncharacterized protein YjiS (DUF1127 family)